MDSQVGLYPQVVPSPEIPKRYQNLRQRHWVHHKSGELKQSQKNHKKNKPKGIQLIKWMMQCRNPWLISSWKGIWKLHGSVYACYFLTSSWANFSFPFPLFRKIVRLELQYPKFISCGKLIITFQYIHSDIYDGIYFLTYILTFYLTLYLTFIQAFYHHSFWNSIWHLFWHSIWNPIWHHWHLELWSWGCCLGPVGTTAITSLHVRSGQKHSYPGFAVRVRQGTLRSSACSWGPAEAKAEEQEAGGGRDTWHKIKQPAPGRQGKISPIIIFPDNAAE